jgi:eukaryotic-like serine/threonine-protein kinase
LSAGKRPPLGLAALLGVLSSPAVVTPPQQPGPDLGDATLIEPQLVTSSEPELPARIERFVVLRRLGVGGMGVVLAAYDPDLDRKVALKLLKPELRLYSGSSGEARLVREAQAMARLSHPNVLPVYDVGTFEGQVFLAIELVEGETLAAWLARSPRTWREIRSMFLAAGEGLAAAHAAGILHRDFKPANVLVGTDGRVRVADFGIARPLDSRSEPVTTESGRNLRLASALASANLRLTGHGAVVGTPSYLAPELVRGQEGTEQADQFSFAVALWEALFGVLPFGEGPPRELAKRIESAPPTVGEREGAVPAWLRRIVERGLAADPAARYPSLRAMLDDLAIDRSARHRRRLLAAGGGLLAVLAAVGTWQLQRSRTDLCSGASERLGSAWDRAAKGRVQAALMATGKPYAAAAVAGVSRALDGYANSWRAGFREACEATRLRGEQSEELLDLRMRCLERRRRELSELVTQLASAAPAVLERAVQAAASLPPVSECEDAASLAAPVPPPRDAAVRAQVEAVGNQLALAKSLEVTGQYEAALKVASATVAAAEQTSYAPTIAEALRQREVLEEFSGDPEAAEATAFQAIAAATRGRHDRVAAQAWADLVWIVGYRQQRYEQAERYALQARAALDRLGGDELLGAELDRFLSGLYTRQGDYARGLQHGQAALTVLERTYGADHPQLGRILNLVGGTYFDSHDYARARDFFDRALANSLQALGPDHPTIAVRLNNLALVYEQEGRFEEALAAQRRALAIEEAAYGGAHPQLAIGYSNLGILLRSAGKLDEGYQAHLRAVVLSESTMEADNPDLGVSIAEMGDSLADLGRYREAIDAHRRGLAILEKAVGADHDWTLSARLGAARDLLELGRAAEALPELRAIVAARQGKGGGETDLALAQFRLARALAATGGSAEEALRWARLAREGFAAQGRLGEKNLREAEAWLQARRAAG